MSDRRGGSGRGAASKRSAATLRSAVLAAVLLAAAGPRPAAAGPGLPGGAGALWLEGDGDHPVAAVETRLEVRITGIIARTRVVQRFRNPEDAWLDAVYAFPLPEGAAVDGLQVQIGERRIEGRIAERRAARHRFERAREAGQRAALLEQDRGDWFRTAASAIEPRGEVEVAIEYQEILSPESDGVRWRLPLAAPPRAGAPEAEAAAAGSGGARSPARTAAPPVEIHIDLEAGFPLAGVESPTHRLEVLSATAERRIFEVRTTADRDLVLSWRWQRSRVPLTRLLAEPLADGSGSAVLLCLLPPDPASLTNSRPARELVLVIDKSGSMAGASMRQAREALRLAIERLQPTDWFDVVAFDEAPTPLFDGSRPATRTNREAALRFVAGLSASGGTDAGRALEAVLPGNSADGERSRLREIVFVSDGGVDDEGPLLARLVEGLGDSRFHAVAIGSAPNGAFLRAAARLGRGSTTFIATRDEVGARMTRLFEKLESPVLTDIEVLWNDEVEMWPPRLPDLHAGEPLVATALVPRLAGEVRLRARIDGRPVEWRVDLEPAAEVRGIARLFARRKIQALEDALAVGADPGRVAAAVLTTALRHQIVSSRTSLVAVDTSPRRPAGDPARTSAGTAPEGDASEPTWGATLPRTATPAPLWRWLGLGLIGAGAALAGTGARRAT